MIILQQTRGALLPVDQLSLDLPFSETKSISARIGPSPTFTRGSGATYFGSDGLIHGVDTSATSNSIGTGSKTFTLSASAGQDQLYKTGDAVEASNGSNSMVGTVTSYTPSTQNLVCNITSITGSGTFTSWRIGYRGPRFDHNPANPTICRGLLIEEGRTNLCLQSENLSTIWTGSGRTISPNSDTAPDGATTADKIVENTSTGFHGASQSVTTVSGSTYIGSIFLKASGRNFAMIYTGVGAGSGRYISIPADGTGSVLGNYNANNATVTLQYLNNGWYRATIIIVASSTSSSFEIYTSTNGTTASFTGDGTSGILAWGGQIELGSLATSYIPTTTIALSRSADVCSITGANFTGMWNNNEGTVFASGDPRGPTYLMANSGVNSNQVSIYRTTELNIFGVATSGTYTANITLSSANGSFNKIAGSYATNDARAVFNNVLGNPDASVTVPTNLIRLNIGAGGVGNQEFANGCIAAIRYYKRSLPNAKLQALTA